MSAFTKPVVISPDGTSASLLERIPLTVGGALQTTENWLQKALFDNPQCLPITEIDPNIGSLIPVCMEIETGSGPADILYVTATGQIVLVETKLWRNPQARREVVGQILDYAKNLAAWSYDTLSSKASVAAKGGPNFLTSLFKARYPDLDESNFVDGVRHSLSNGDFLLLIVGDGIRSDAESLVSFLEKFGHLRFRLGLVEVATYPLPDGSRLLLPRILARTEVIQRTILISPNGSVTSPDDVRSEDTGPRTSVDQREWFAAFWSEFLKQLKLEDESLRPLEPAKQTNQFFWMPPYGGMAWISAYIAPASGKAGVYLSFAKQYARGMEISDILEEDKEAIERELGAPLAWSRSTPGRVHIGAPSIGFEDLNADQDRARVTAYLADLTQRMIGVMRPRLEVATRDPNLVT